jgi:P2X purinoceptor 4
MSWQETLDSLLWYRTVKIVQIRNWKLGLVHYGVMLLIFAYIIGWVIIYKKGYQGQGSLIGTASSKIKGVSYWNNNGTKQVWDEYDVVYPAVEQNAFFITTNFWPTYHQVRDVCPGDVACNETVNCPYNKLTGSGITNGTCDYSSNRCFMSAWCPLENELPNDTNYLEGIGDFTVFVKVNVRFPTYNIQLNNVNGTKLTENYNLFVVNSILQEAGTNLKNIQQDGAILLMKIDYLCDFDKNEDQCIPTITFTRIDVGSVLSKGFNFRWVNYYWVNGVQTRDLMKFYGIRVLILISGTGSKFDIIPMILNIASGLALLSIATVVVDFIALYVHPQRKYYNEHKFEDTKEDFSQNLSEKDSLLSSTEHKTF